MAEWAWGGSVEEYDEWLQSTHYGWLKAMKEEMKDVPMSGEEGKLRGDLLQDLHEGVQCLEEELGVTHRILDRRARLKHLAAAEEAGGVVLQTYTVPLQEVRADLSQWVEPLRSEYVSLTQTTKAVIPITLEDIKDDPGVEFAPGKLVATIKAPDGRRRARIVVCGNRVESLDQDSTSTQTTCGNREVKGTDLYAAGIDGCAVRTTLRSSAARGWTGFPTCTT